MVLMLLYLAKFFADLPTKPSLAASRLTQQGFLPHCVREQASIKCENGPVYWHWFIGRWYQDA